jgi:hypothetical protein
VIAHDLFVVPADISQELEIAKEHASRYRWLLDRVARLLTELGPIDPFALEIERRELLREIGR